MTAISAIFHGYKHIPTRKAFQLVLEVPEENTAQVFEVLGIPNSSTDIWVGVARLAKQPTEETNVQESGNNWTAGAVLPEGQEAV